MPGIRIVQFGPAPWSCRIVTSCLVFSNLMCKDLWSSFCFGIREPLSVVFAFGWPGFIRKTADVGYYHRYMLNNMCYNYNDTEEWIENGSWHNKFSQLGCPSFIYWMNEHKQIFVECLSCSRHSFRYWYYDKGWNNLCLLSACYQEGAETITGKYTPLRQYWRMA